MWVLTFLTMHQVRFIIYCITSQQMNTVSEASLIESHLIELGTQSNWNRILRIKTESIQEIQGDRKSTRNYENTLL